MLGRLPLMLLLFTGLATAGDAHVGRKVQKELRLTGEETIQLFQPAEYRYPERHMTGPGDSIGFTTYDYGTNGSVNHNLINYGDGDLSLGRMAAVQPTNPDRGTFYSHSTDGGATWRPLLKVETPTATLRTGWGNIDQFRIPVAGGIEATVAHAGLTVNVDVERGVGSWNQSTTVSAVSATWPRLAIGDDLDMHIIAGAGNPPTAYVYTRSLDAGASFNPTDMPVLTSSTPSADGWDIAARGSKVVIVGSRKLQEVMLSCRCQRTGEPRGAPR